MYEAFYGLTSKPFQLNPGPQLLLRQQAAQPRQGLPEYGVSRNEGFVVITGEIGAGKTTILRALIEGLTAATSSPAIW
jgi:general secretion pathway protein A